MTTMVTTTMWRIFWVSSAVVMLLVSKEVEALFSTSYIADAYSSNVSWFAPFYSGGGYCSEARSFAIALDKVGFTNFTIVQHGDSLNADFMSGQSDKEKQFFHKHQISSRQNGFPRISVCHSEPGAWYTPEPRYHTSPCPFYKQETKLKYYKVGRTMFETDRIPSGWLPRLNYMDEIWVPTLQSKSIFQEAGVPNHKLRVIGEAVDTDFFVPMDRRAVTFKKYDIPQLEKVSMSTFVFLFVGKFEKRKGIEILLEAYFKEFSSVDSVVLMLLTGAYHSSDDFQKQVSDILAEKQLAKPFPPKYTILSNVKQIGLPALYSHAHVLVIPSHGEGWGRPHMEAMSCQTPVIATNWSGPTSFITRENGYVLPIEGMVDTPNWPGHQWAQPSMVELMKLMRHAYSNREEVLQKGEQARKDMIEHFSLKKMGEKLVREFNRIDRILNNLPSLSGDEVENITTLPTHVEL